MLYVNTRNKIQTYTAHQALTHDSQTNSGMVAPLRLPIIRKEELLGFCKCGFGGVIAFVLNKFFSKGITAEYIERALNFHSPVLDLIDRKTLLVRFDGKLNDIEEVVSKLLIEREETPVLWARMAVRIGLLFGLLSELSKCGIRCGDFAVTSSDPLSFVPVLYSKLMGASINKIIIGASTEDATWNYLHKGQNATDESFEYCIHGISMLKNHDKILSDMFSSVVSNHRAKEIISNVQSTHKKCIDLSAAFSYGALQDYRAITGENHTTIIFSN